MLSYMAFGQTTAPYVARKQGETIRECLMHGGMLREATCDVIDSHRGRYIELATGINSLMSMNYVDGYSVGPQSKIGIVLADRSRWELEEEIRWAFNRKALVARGALRYYWPVEKETMIEVFGGKSMKDFDPDPTMPMSQSLTASGLCGWNHYKLYESTNAGVKFAVPLTFDLLLSAEMGWERRRQQENSYHRNLFGAHAQDNTPRIGVAHTAHELTLYDGPIDADLAKAKIRFDFKYFRTLVVKDDMTTFEKLPYPTVSLLLDMGMGKNRNADRFRFMAIDLRTDYTQELAPQGDVMRYAASAGFMMKHGSIGLADWHHLDASRFWWQRGQELSRFALLDNYELSTDQYWAEGHVEWNSPRMLLTRWMPVQDWREYLQCHVAKVADHYCHWEVQYGWELAKLLRVGVSVGLDDGRYRGTAVTMTIAMDALSR